MYPCPCPYLSRSPCVSELSSFRVISLSVPSSSYNIWYMMFNLCTMGLHTYRCIHPRRKRNINPAKLKTFLTFCYPFAVLHVNAFVGVRAIRLGAFKRSFYASKFTGMFHLLHAGFFVHFSLVFSLLLAQSFKYIDKWHMMEEEDPLLMIIQNVCATRKM